MSDDVLRELATMVKRMREAQSRYFMSRSWDDMQRSIRLEREVDALVDAVLKGGEAPRSVWVVYLRGRGGVVTDVVTFYSREAADVLYRDLASRFGRDRVSKVETRPGEVPMFWGMAQEG